MSKDQLALQAADGTVQCDHPTCQEPLDTSQCTDRCVVVECDAGVVNEQCEQGCVVERAYGCPYEEEESGLVRANGEVSITHYLFPDKETVLLSSCLYPSSVVQLSLRLRVYVIQEFVRRSLFL